MYNYIVSLSHSEAHFLPARFKRQLCNNYYTAESCDEEMRFRM